MGTGLVAIMIFCESAKTWLLALATIQGIYVVGKEVTGYWVLFKVEFWLLGDQHANQGFGLDGNLYELPG